MVTRRQTVLGLLAAGSGGAVLSSGAFNSSVNAGSDLRVVVESELTLKPEREDEAYVETDNDGEVTAIVAKDLNQTAVSLFEGIVRITNNGDITYDEIDFEFKITNPNTGNTPATQHALAAIKDTLGIRYRGTNIHDGADTATILDSSSEDLGPGEHETFGLSVNLLGSSSPGNVNSFPDVVFNVKLVITAKRDV